MNYDVRLEFGVKQEMRDGIKLSSDIYRPDSEERFPTIVTRSPYMTVEGFQKRFADEAKFFASRGYVYVIQDCRGKNDSEGTYQPFFDDPTDGYDTLEWCARQVWSNGSIGTIGASYQAWNQWQAATLSPPNLKAMICIVSLPDPVINVPFQNGALVLWMAEWMAMVDGKKNTDPSIFDTAKIYNHLPLRSMDGKFGRPNSAIWQKWIDHPSSDEFWRKTFYQDKFDRIDLPVLHISGWYDDIIGTHLNYIGMKRHAPSEKARENQKLIIGPWQHHVNVTRRLSSIDFGESSLIDLRKIELDWFDYWLKGIDNGVMNQPMVDIFVMGRNSWKRSDAWPFEGTKYIKYFLHSSGRANTSAGDGLLSAIEPKDTEGSNSVDTYTYDPKDPCPNLFDDTSGVAAEAPHDQRPIERRDDVLVYSTPRLDSEVEVSGPVKVKLYASSSALDTDFWAQLVDVFPNGYSMHLTEGILRARYRNSLAKPELLEPHKVYQFSIDLWVTSNAFLKDHRIRLDVSTSSFPKYDRNPNTGHEFGRDAEMQVAEQKIYHTKGFPSHVVLPIAQS
ncbi:MAG TPA: CocE/NonD family hydrolase [Nitrososphaerales archaeon]|nr:CocE/NonD family hydrolase [Nitrososphaerales archaeon]